MRVLSLSAFFFGSLILGGCGPAPAPAPTASRPAAPSGASAAKSETEGHTHSHQREKILIADAGPHHALLTAHLSPSGNELDIFFETPVDKDPQPVALSIASFEAQATAGDGEARTLTFEPAPADERPAGEPAERCSHFVAKAPWMKPDQALYLVARLTIDGEAIAIRWKDFLPSRYAHHIE